MADAVALGRLCPEIPAPAQCRSAQPGLRFVAVTAFMADLYYGNVFLL